MEKRVGLDELANGYRISTVRLSYDHNWSPEGPPLWYETMVFEGDSYRDLDMERYSTREEAEEGHQRMVAKWQDLPGEDSE